MFDRVAMRTGRVRCVVVPSPSLPELFEPQAHTWPSQVRASVNADPADNAVTPVSVGTSTGVGLSVEDPSPSWPLPFSPNECTRPSVVARTVCETPAEAPPGPKGPVRLYV